MEKHKFASISLTVRDRAISSKFSTHRVLLAIFKKISPPQKWRPFCIFEFLPKMAKQKFASISLTVRDRVISSEFSTHRVLLAIFKKFPLLKNGGHFVFSNFCQKMEKHKFATISVTVRDRAISSKFSTHRVSKQCTLGNFQKKFPLPKNGSHFEFSNFCQKLTNRNLLLSP